MLSFYIVSVSFFVLIQILETPLSASKNADSETHSSSGQAILVVDASSTTISSGPENEYEVTYLLHPALPIMRPCWVNLAVGEVNLTGGEVLAGSLY